MNMNPETAAILDTLRTFAESRPGIDPANYGSWRDYRRESAEVTRDLHHARVLISAASWIAPEYLRALLTDSRRLSLRPDGGLSYCAGQYYPTEYRKAVCRAVASALWSAMADAYASERRAAGVPLGQRYEGFRDRAMPRLRRQFGRTITERYF